MARNCLKDINIPSDMKNPLKAAYIKGAKAAIDAKSLDDCPYIDKRTDANRVTFSRAFIKTWERGFIDHATGVNF